MVDGSDQSLLGTKWKKLMVVGVAWGFRVGGLWGAIGGAAIGGGFCLAEHAIRSKP